MDDHTQEAAIGIDVGGTSIKGGLVARDGTVLSKQAIATEASGGVNHVVSRMVGLVERLREVASTSSLLVDAIGLGMPGTLSRRRGVVIAPPNLPGWRNVPVVVDLSSATGLKVVLDNDANNAALGEYLCGAGRGVRDMVMLTLGTGIGGGLILDGKLWHGAFENAGELGHMIVEAGGRPCKCGQSGCLEAYASATATAERATERLERGESSSLKAVLDRGAAIQPEMVVEAAEAGDSLARQIWEDTCRHLAIGCINLQHAVNPERIVFAGGLSGAGDRLLKPVQRAFQEMCSSMLGVDADMRIAELGNDAGFIGSALSVFHTD